MILIAILKNLNDYCNNLEFFVNLNEMITLFFKLKQHSFIDLAF